MNTLNSADGSGFLEKNLLCLRRRSFILPGPGSEKEKIEVLRAVNGSPAISVNGKLLHSGVDPNTEGRKFAKGLKLQKGDHLLLYGFGLGYHIPPILDALGSSGKIIVVDLNEAVIFKALSLLDFSSLLLNPGFFLITGGRSEYLVLRSLDDAFTEIQEDIEESKRSVAVYPPSYQLFPAGYENIKRAFDVRQMEKRFDSVLGDKAKSNFKKNSQYIQSSRKVSEIYGRYKGYLGVLVGSGPSLDSVMRYLKYLPEKSFLIAADSSVAALLANGIKVDAMLSVDPQEAVYRLACTASKNRVPLFFVADSNHALVRSHRGERFFVSREETGEENAPVLSGGAVSCIGLELLIKFAANPIMQIGIDSSFPGARYYAGYISDEMFDEITRLETLGAAHKRRVDIGDKVSLKNFAGGETVSHLNLFSYMRTIETLAKCNNEVSMFVTETSGVAMNRVSPKNPADIIYEKS